MAEIIIMPLIIRDERTRLRTKRNAAAAKTETAQFTWFTASESAPTGAPLVAQATRDEGADVYSASLHELLNFEKFMKFMSLTPCSELSIPK